MRLDQYLVKESFARSRTQASDLIKAGRVEVCIEGVWSKVFKASFKCTENIEIKVKAENEFLWVSRSGEKLNLALKKLNLDFKNMSVLDVGQSTGGFSECALKFGAKEVIGVDVGRDQLSKKIKENERVTMYEGLDARNIIEDERFSHEEFDFLIMDLSFISITKVVKGLVPLFKPGAKGLILVKPQFEVGRDQIQKGGIVLGSEVFLDCQRLVFDCISKINQISIMDYFPSGLRGKDGNQEFFCFCEFH